MSLVTISDMRGPFAFDAGAKFSLEDVLGCGPCGKERFLLRQSL